jgi:mevalonate kinase
LDSTAEIIRTSLWLQNQPANMHIFHDMAYLLALFVPALERVDLPALGHLMNLHQLLQEKMGTSCPEVETLIKASIGAGALGAKMSGSGRGGVIMALAEPGQESDVAAAIDAAGGRNYIVDTAVPGVRIEPVQAWETAAQHS